MTKFTGTENAAQKEPFVSAHFSRDVVPYYLWGSGEHGSGWRNAPARIFGQEALNNASRTAKSDLWKQYFSSRYGGQTNAR